MDTLFNGTRRVFLAAGGAFAMLAPGSRAFAQDGERPIGIIGAGNIGGTLGALWVKAGHPVMFSSRVPEELADMVKSLGPLAIAGTVLQALNFSDIIFIAVPYAAIPQIGHDYAEQLQGKIILDATNAVSSRDGAAITTEADTNGIGITTQKYLPGTHVVRAFNLTGANVFQKEANRPDPRMAIPIAGDDPEALRLAQVLVHDAGFDPVVTGGLATASKFQQRAPGTIYGFNGTAAELKAKLGL